MTSLLMLRDIVARVAALFLLDWTFCRMLDAFDNSPDANIGAGLLGFALLIAAAGLWGAIDGRHQHVVRLAGTWILTGALTAIALVVQTNVSYAPIDGSVLRADLQDSAPFLAGLIIVPALIGGGVSVLARRPSLPAPLPG